MIKNEVLENQMHFSLSQYPTNFMTGPDMTHCCHGNKQTDAKATI